MAAAAIMACSCSIKTLPQQFDSFVDGVEKESNGYSDQDWKDANTSLEALVDKYKEDYDKLSDEERSQICNAIGRYAAIEAKRAGQEVLKGLNEVMDEVPGILKELGAAVNDIMGGISGFLEGLSSESGSSTEAQ